VEALTGGTPRGPAGEPELERLRVTHDRLIEAYVSAHRAARNILIRPVVDAHLRKGTHALRDAYVQARESTFRFPAAETWLDEEIENLEELEPTFDRRTGASSWLKGVSGVFGFPGVTSVLAVTGVSGAALALFKECLCHLVGVAPLVIMFALIATFIVAYELKRALFLRTPEGAGGGIYGLEDEAFAAADASKPPERKLDVIGWALIPATYVLFGLIGTAAIDKGLFSNDKFGLIWWLAGLTAAVALVMYVRARRRTPS
jgi:hypothetical protein